MPVPTCAERPSAADRTPEDTQAAPRTLDWLTQQMLVTGEDDDRREFVDQLRKADEHARAILALGSPLLAGDDGGRVIEATRTLVCHAGNLDNMDGDINAGQYNHDAVTSGCLFESIEAAYRLGMTVGIRLGDLAGEPVSAATPAPTAAPAPDLAARAREITQMATDRATTPDDKEPEDVSEVMIRLVSALWLAKSVVDCQCGGDADVHEQGWWALTELLEHAATDLDAAHGRYLVEYNAMERAAEGGAA